MAALSIEPVRFDAQTIEPPEIAGTRAGFEVREHLLLKCRHECVHGGGMSGDAVLNIDHIVPH